MSHLNNTPRGTPAPSEAGGTRTTTTASRDDSKVAKPDLYHGDRQGLDDWLTQMEMYFQFTPVEANKKTLFATTYLRGRAQHWMKPMLMKYLDGKGDTDGILGSFAKFKEEIRRIFGISNEDKVAVRLIQHVRQHTSASDYAAKFQEYAQVTGWDDSALMTMYRRGLKENVKDELMRTAGKVEDLDDLIRASITIDDDLYERAMEKRHDVAPRGRAGYVPYRASNNFNKGNKRNQYQDPYGPMPMELDVTEGRRSNGKKQFKGKSTMTCYGCGKKGHMARDCHSKNKVPRRQFNMTQRRPEEPTRNEPEEPKPEPEPLKQDRHGLLSWTACYDDSCLIHYSSKMGSGWFPSRPKGRGKGYFNVISQKDDLEEGEIEEEEVESDPEEGSSDEEEESADEDDNDHPCNVDGIEILHAYVPACLAKMFDIMIRHAEEAFPMVNVDYDFKTFIQERPPLGSIFAPAGYIIPTGERVNRSMRDGVNLLRSRYDQAQKQQRVLYERHLHELKTGAKISGKVAFANLPVNIDSGKE
ncbi:hypothetical protein D6C98_10097 [Aureobasidium pullulans]|nr:hypothetical protein D6C98_10097 [Aureobasidium pullulans]